LEEESSAPAPAVAVAHSPKTRKRDEAFEALVRIQGASLAALTPTERGSINKALKDIRTVAPDVTAAMLDTAAMRWRRKYPTSSPTAMTLAKHWSELTAGITAESTSIDPDRQARARAQIVSLQHDLDGIRALPVCDDSEAMAARREKAAELQGKINALRPVAGMPAR
jgi:DUF917 family protein